MHASTPSKWENGMFVMLLLFARRFLIPHLCFLSHYGSAWYQIYIFFTTNKLSNTEGFFFVVLQVLVWQAHFACLLYWMSNSNSLFLSTMTSSIWIHILYIMCTVICVSTVNATKAEYQKYYNELVNLHKLDLYLHTMLLNCTYPVSWEKIIRETCNTYSSAAA